MIETVNATTMKLELWDDSKIIQENSFVEGKGRVYRQDDRVFSSVTTILGKVEDKSFLAGWKKRVGEDKAEQIKNQASAHGTATHNALENHFKIQYPELILQEKPELRSLAIAEQEQAIAKIQDNLKLSVKQQELISTFAPLFPYLKPVALEKRIFWQDTQNPKLGFGGTADAFKFIDCSLLPANAQPLFAEDGKSYALCVLDWKNFNKRKRPIEYTRGYKKAGEYIPPKPYYPLIKYALQLSAYSAAFNKLTDRRYKLTQGVLACAYNTSEPDEEPQYELDLYYFNQRSIMWFWMEFRKILDVFYNDGNYDWKGFCTAAHNAGVLGENIEFSYENYDDLTAA